MTVEQRLRRFVERPVRERGDEYFARGRVLSVETHPDLVLVTVRGAREYEVELLIEEDAVVATCECRFFEDHLEPCKHIWAAIRTADARNLLPAKIENLDVLPNADVDLDEEPSATGRKEPWSRFFDALPFEPPPRIRTRSRLPDEIAFEFTSHSFHLQAVQFAAVGRTKKKNGEWGRWTPARIPSDRRQDLDPFVRETLGLMQGPSYGWATTESMTVDSNMAAWWIERLARHRLLLMRVPDGMRRIEWDDQAAWAFRIEVTANQDKGVYVVDGTLRRGEAALPLRAVRFVAPGVIMTEDVAAPLERSDDLRWIPALRTHAPVEVPFAERERFRDALLRASPAGITLPPELRLEVVDVEPVPVLALTTDPYGTDFDAELRFRYGDQEMSAQSPQTQWLVDSRVIRRDPGAEARHRRRLETTRVVATYGGYRLRLAYFEEVLRQLTADGWHIEIEGKPLRSADDFAIDISSGIDWFDLDASATFGEQKLALPELLAAAEARRSILPLADGSFALVPQQWAARLAPLAEMGQKKGGAYRFARHQALLLDAMLEARELRADRPWHELRQRLSGSSASAETEPSTFGGTLRPYQREGLGWMSNLRETGLGGCLADDMGLGKTVQMLALLEKLRLEGRGPSLVVAPRSLLFNWAAEAARFAPGLRVVEHHGSEREKESDEAFRNCDLVLTTYATMRLDISQLATVEFEYVILDEAQSIKNATSQVAKAAGLLKSRHRLALSGTPIENHLGELWSLFNFLNPGLLGGARHFNRTFAGKNAPPERREMLARALRPLILRRTKEQVAPELPERIEQTLWCELDADQRRQYDELRDHYRRAILGRIASEGVNKSRMQVLEALLRLRQVACHPALIDAGYDGSSAKMDVLLAEIAEVVESGHRALVFSQFTSLLHLVRAQLGSKRTPYLYLDGATRDREAVVSEFQKQDGPPLFLISLKAGGVGLNLTNADYVFLLDPWWNPAVEAQAVDRAHRIGRIRPVVAYRVIARDTVEEKILELQTRKKELADSIISEDNSVLRGLEPDDIAMLLS
jgi:superfamily II DNA or RNA helicase